MKMSDILRHVADRMDQTEPESETGVPMEKDNPVTMVPPLQQKMNILKKAAGKHNAFDAHDELTHAGEHDELDDIRKIAGLTVMIDGPQGEMGE
jgi:hypothetical protein